MGKISIVISAYNEEKNIEACLLSVKHFADEIIVVDHDSMDNTQKLAKKYTPHVYNQKNDPQKIDLQKNYGFSKATGDWILSLDADERVSPELAKEIKEVTSQESDVSAYSLQRKNIIFGKWIQHTGWFPDPHTRLFKKGKAKYISEHVHEHLTVDGKVGTLRHMLYHEHYKNIIEFINKMMVYAPNEADHMLKHGYTFSYLDALRFPAQEFMSRFFAREGYKDGLHGLVLSLLQAFYHLVVFVCIWEKKDYQEVSNEKFLTDIQKESYSLAKELSYWFFTEGMKAKGSLQKIALKIKHKLSL